ncbi:MAG: DUF4932 domain-containing protein [Bacteroidota bacterium]
MMRRLSCVLCLLFSISHLASAQEKKIKVEFNKNIELICALNNLISTEFLKDSVADPYLYHTTRLMRLNYEHFRSYSQHPAVVTIQQMSDKIGTGVYLLGLFYKPLPEVEQQYPVSEVILQAIHPNLDSANQLVKAYFEQLAHFYLDTHFEEYFASNQSLYQLVIQEVSRNMPGNRFVPTLEAYYGAKKDDYHVIAMPFFKSNWGNSWQIEHKGKFQVYNIVSPLQAQVLGSNQRVLEAGYNNAAEIRNLSVHEFGHSFVNPFTMRAPYEEQINQYKHLFKPIPKNGQYSDWLTIFNEHMVRAGEIRIALQLGQEKESKRLQEAYKDWMYMPHFLEQLKQYEKNRKKYKRFEDYLPVLIASLAHLK